LFLHKNNFVIGLHKFCLYTCFKFEVLEKVENLFEKNDQHFFFKYQKSNFPTISFYFFDDRSTVPRCSTSAPSQPWTDLRPSEAASRFASRISVPGNSELNTESPGPPTTGRFTTLPKLMATPETSK
jgi:hypothetical protein